MGPAPAKPARIVIDANVLVSAAIAPGRTGGSVLGRTVDRALSGEVTVITCPSGRGPPTASEGAPERRMNVAP